MQEVHIFLITSSHAPKMRKAWYRYILVCQGKTLEKKTDVQDVTGHQLVMECAVAALQRMIRPAMITIHTDSHYLANGHGKMTLWKSEGWKRGNGQELNPDDPSLDVYKEYINCSRPLPEWEDGTPQEIKDELKEEPKPGWVHWFFSFDDNAGLPEEKKQRIIQNTPKGTKIWKNKIEGLRGKATGLVFPNFLRKKHVVSEEWVRSQMAAGKIRFKKFTCGLDTSYSSKSPDTIAMMFQGITEDRKLITLAEKVYSNKDLDQPLAPSDTAVKFIEFLERCRKDWGFAKDTFVDCADAATITELRKYKRLHSCLYNFVESYKKVTILDRIKLQLGWIQQDCYLVLDTCTNHISEMEKYSWDDEKDVPEDKNDHTINSQQYGWIPFRNMIGFEVEEQKR